MKRRNMIAALGAMFALPFARLRKKKPYTVSANDRAFNGDVDKALDQFFAPPENIIHLQGPPFSFAGHYPPGTRYYDTKQRAFWTINDCGWWAKDGAELKGQLDGCMSTDV